MWVLFALLAALAGAVLAVLTKAALKDVNSSLALAVQSVLILVISWGAAAVQGSPGKLGEIDGRTWIYLVLAGIVTSASYLLLFRALALGESTRVVTLDRLSLVFAIILGAVFLKEKVTAQVSLGGALMAAGALLIALAKK